MPRRSFSGLRVLVTGSSTGIGRELVLELAPQGSRVVAMARREERLIELQKEASSGGSSVQYFLGDVTDPCSRLAALELCQEKLGGLDCLVNNAGVGAIGPFDQAEEERLRRIMEVNFFAPVEFTRAALPNLRKGTHPLIVNVSSVLGHRAVPFKSE